MDAEELIKNLRIATICNIVATFILLACIALVTICVVVIANINDDDNRVVLVKGDNLYER